FSLFIERGCNGAKSSDISRIGLEGGRPRRVLPRRLETSGLKCADIAV
ncbi:unnamed protein product, partial [Didymodactylos carnosus]